MSVEAMKQALEALECLFGIPERFTGKGGGDVAVWTLGGSYRAQQAIPVLRQAIEQAEKQEPITYDKTEMNCFVQELYDRKMQEGKRGHYETMFHCVHQAIKRLYTTTQLQQGEKSEPLDKVYICNSCGHAYQIQPPSQCDCLGDEKYTEGYIYTTPQPKQEPVAWMCSDESLLHKGYSRFSRNCEGAWNIPVYTTAQREWVGLTDEETDHLFNMYERSSFGLVRAVEAKLKEKNT